MAAGMGSRYGGLKQLDGIGAHGEVILDYSVYDAYRAGFEKVVFVIKPEMEADFRERVGDRIAKRMQVEYAFQRLDDLPEGYSVPEGRVKPWGTCHAVLSARHAVDGPFAVINADDFYGQDSFRVLAKALTDMEGKTGEYCMVGFRVGNTLSESGEVSRGVCHISDDGFLTTVTERHHIMRRDGGAVSFLDESGNAIVLDDNALVSMNMWGFTPDYFEYSKKAFVEFLSEHGNDLKTEFYIPSMVNELITRGAASVKVYDTTSSWFGVTYAADKPSVMANVTKLVEEGVYPNKLFDFK